MRYRLLCSILVLLLGNPTAALWAQCSLGEVEVAVTIVPDNYPNETAWVIRDGNGDSLATQMNALGDTVCVPANQCLEFEIIDSYDDGICCDFGNGSYTVTYGGAVVAQGGQFGWSETTFFGQCPLGSSCHFPDTVSEGSHVAPNRDHWYLFVPDSTGSYLISTCAGNFCNTKIWVYDHCQGLVWDNTNSGTTFFSNDACGVRAEVTAYFAQGDPYWIRIGDHAGSCGGTIDWTLNYLGPIVGCTDSLACNFHPLAQVNDTCYYPGDSLCPNGPDLMIVSSALESSLAIDSILQADPCMVNEGCLVNYGRRDILRFTTWIKNIGNMDYFIGDPQDNPQMFQFDNCHNHYHYDGYAEYILYDSASQPLPIGFKNGFCVIDLECSGGGTPKYGCSNMGITAGCGDIYGASLDCQWVDITDVPSGRYTLVVRTNWDQQPDALGNHELDYTNNWGQVCFFLNKDTVTGNHTISLDPNCPVFVDCLGDPFGSAIHDCEGVCDGPALHGDLDENLVREVQDGQLYVNGILGLTAAVDDCSDLNLDGEITVSDAALVTACAVRGDSFPKPGGGWTNYCDFPGGLTNVNQTATIRVGAIDYLNQTVDIELLNPDNEVLAYQFSVSGLTLSSADNLIPVSDYPIQPQVNASGMVVGISYEDSLIARGPSWKPLVRLHYSQLTAPGQVCIDQAIDVVNKNYEDVVVVADTACLTIVAAPEPVGQFQVKVYPNPFSSTTTLQFSPVARKAYYLELVDLTGHVVRDYGRLRRPRVTIARDDLLPGLYFYRLREGEREQVGKLLIL
ncbi:MAG: lysyl oxidase family protein [Bacteroidota bacterium]